MKKNILACLFFAVFGFAPAAMPAASSPVRIIIVDSYHREYLWSQHANEGFCEAMLKFGYLDNRQQAADFSQKDYTETSRVIIKKLWMDTKRKKSKDEQTKIMLDFTRAIKDFNPNLIFLGDDNAANYIGNQFLDSNIPIVFWGVNNTPVKYGLVDSKERPGHNVTGVYQTTYYKESLLFLKKIVPNLNTFAVLSDDTTTGRIHNKALSHLERKGMLPLKLVDVVATNDYEEWKKRALELQQQVDAFFIASSNGLKDKTGRIVSNEEAGRWYLANITIPEATGFRYRVELGWLSAADDSGFNQGYEAVVIAHEILAKGADPAAFPPKVPKRGPLMVNKKRARMLGITLTKDMGIEEYIEHAGALQTDETKRPEKKRILVVSSYHREYSWSQDTHSGFCDALLQLRYFDNQDQVEQYTKTDGVETSRMVLKKIWMDSKRISSDADQEKKSIQFYQIAKEFKPHLIFLGDDNAAKFLGTKLLDSKTPVVFWGLNNNPVKFGLLDSKEKPGHNVTGVYQSGYYREAFQLLLRLAPKARTFAILADGTITARSHYKALEHLARTGGLPMQLVETVNTSDYATWKAKALVLQNKVDVFFVAQYSGLKDKKGNHVPPPEVAKWYLANIKIPEATRFIFVKQGLLCSAVDLGYNQGYEAVLIGHDILAHGADPATYPPRTPKRGPLTVNKQRAAMLGIKLTDDMGIEQYYSADKE